MADLADTVARELMEERQYALEKGRPTPSSSACATSSSFAADAFYGSGGGEAPHAGAAVARNSLTNSTPRVLHFNGGAKDQFKRYRDHLLSRAPCLPVGSSIATPGGELPFKEICPRHPLPSLKRAC